MLYHDLPDMRVLDLDWFRFTEYRQGKSGQEAENNAQKRCLNEVDSQTNFIFTSTGTTRFFAKTMQVIKQKEEKCLHVHLKVSAATCLVRARNRKQHNAPLPYKMNVKKVIHRYDDHYRRPDFQPNLTIKQSTPKEITRKILDTLFELHYV